MFPSVRGQKRQTIRAVAVDVAPLIDMVFILLVFFIVTSTFAKDTGIVVDRPAASTGEALSETSLRVSLAPSGQLFVEGRPVATRDLQRSLRALLERDPLVHVVLIADRRTPSGRLVEVMDEARAVGVSRIAVATREVNE